ncbi:MAG: polyribonucleotide nucleotidyltransferase [Candidatus Pacebacteria bacterium]|nr:polyribonucleotide nucleotidyltransferase [Candidatus Paceibacterota bacterium]
MKTESFELDLNGKPLVVEFNNLAERANGSVFVKYGDTAVMANCVIAKKEIEGADFFPLTVLYEEKFYAAGKILGSRFVKRETRPSEQATLNSRLIDRAIRPLFPANLHHEVQVVITCLAWDQESDPAVLSLFAASAALLCSDIPWHGPVAPVRIAEKDGEIIPFPTIKQREESSLDLVISTLKSESGKEMLVNMIEAGMKEAPEELILKAIESTKPLQESLISFQKQICAKMGKKKLEIKEAEKDAALEKSVEEFLGDNLSKVIFDSKEEMDDLKNRLAEHLRGVSDDPEKLRQGLAFFEKEAERIIHEGAIDKGLRAEGRKTNELRCIGCDVGLFKRVHGTGLFTRGQTKVLSLLTLGSPGDQKIFEEMELQGKKRFMHQYNFPPYSVGETGPMRGPGRREIGHGMLGEKALRPMIPGAEEFPYTIRIVSEVLCSNGSSSMASTCAACLALMDAGVPIKRPVSGIAMGLMMEMADDKSTENKKYAILTDVQGEEDHYGDMDFKVAGTEQGITALQMDLKVRGITSKIIKEALAQSKPARLQILKEMLAVIPEPRKTLSPFAPRIYIIHIKPEQIGEVIGTGGKTINEIICECNVSIDIEDNGEVYVTAENEESARKAINWIENITREAKVGEVFQGKVKRIMDFGAFVEILPGQEGLVHISQLDDRRVEKVTDVIKLGQTIPVKVISIDDQGRINLSLKEAKK